MSAPQIRIITIACLVAIAAGCDSSKKSGQDLLQSASPSERRRGVRALGESHDPAAASALAPILRADPDLDTRIDAVQALVELPGPEATKLLVAKAQSDDASLVRGAALDALASRKDADAVPGLIELWGLDRGPDDNVARLGAVRALVKIGGPTVPALLASLASPSPTIRESALEVLGQIGDRSIADRIAPLTQDPNGAVRNAAEFALAEIARRQSTH